MRQLILAALLGALLRDLQVWCAARVFCWRRRRQSQALAAAARERREKAVSAIATETAAKLRSIPFVVHPDTFMEGLVCSREITVLLRSQDRRRFFATETDGETN